MLSRAQSESIVEAGILAPSADNRHMLRFRVAEHAIVIRGSPEFESAPFHRRVLALVSLGAVVENMILRAATLGFDAEPMEPDGAFSGPRLAELRFRPASPQVSALADAIPARHTNRRALYRGPQLSSEQMGQVTEEAGVFAGVRLLWLDAPELRRQTLRLVTIAESERFRSEPLHADLFSSIRFDVGWHSTVAEGLPPGALGVEPPMRPFFKALRNWQVTRVLAGLGVHRLVGLRAAYLPCRTAPHVCALATSLDLDRGAVAVGRALERIWLRATCYGMALQPFAGAALLALEGYRDVDDGVRRRLVSGWSRLCADALPIMVFRIGHARPPTVRSARPGVSDLLDSSGRAVD
jgi:hypothetical protein